MEKPSSPIIVADSSGLVSLAVVNDRNHQVAVGEARRLLKVQANVIVPGEVFAETVNVLGNKSGHEAALWVARELSAGATFSIADSTEDLRMEALERFKGQPASVSFTDCIVMAVADFYSTNTVFGFDQVFARNGYRALSARR